MTKPEKVEKTSKEIAGVEGLPLKQTDQLKPYPKNARTHTKEQITKVANSIKAFGWTNPILVGRDNVIIAGHCRLLAAKELGLTEVPIRDLSHMTKAQAQAYVIADNQLALNAGWDNGILGDELNELNDLGFDLELLGFPGDELDALLEGPIEPIDTDEDGGVPESFETRCKLGDVWLLGDHRLMCGDSTNALDVSKLCKDFAPNLMVTDPPYGVNYDPSWREGADLGAGERSTGKVLNDDRANWAETYSLFTGSVAYIWHGGLHTHEVAQNIIDCGFNLVAQIIWVKQHFVLSRGDYHWQHEPCWYAVRKGSKHFYNGARDQASIWEIKNNNSFGNSNKEETVGHGTQKPLECMLRPIINNSKEREHVYDPFGGSGTTLIACEKSKRKCLMMELSPTYCDMILQRWENLTEQKATLEAFDG